MAKIELVILGGPKAQGRPRTRIVQTKVHAEELIRNIKARIACIGHPNEPADWSEEIRQMDVVLAQSKKKTFATIYEDKKDKEAKARIVAAVKNQAPEKPLAGPLSVTIGFYMPRPKGHLRTGKYAGQLKDTANFFCDKRPDIDNLAKLVLDALNKVFWYDDGQIVMLEARKIYNTKPQMKIVIETLNNEENRTERPLLLR